ncbi:MAG: Diguanylate cyclase protein [Devosia sp.]|uniref:putative bifunctional diguanylate cyclase/phosphodiesterase n=1 Tax=Devosia sp. TaxID=1871048 RepID=UPI00263569FB|nr:EAL domain-containing protein [Devosia sp.]MDB5527688.1 Diguanylate cyclase protein [Devosia sp.]
MIPPTTAPHRLSFHIAWISLAFGSFLVLALVLCASWMAREIDTAALNEQKSAIATNVASMGQRIQLEQSTAADRTDGVFYSMHGRFAWVPNGLAQWISQQFNHDRVYVYYLDGSVLQASSHGRQANGAILSSDRQAVALLSTQVAYNLSAPTVGGQRLSAGSFGFRRLEDGSLAFISVRPLDAFASTAGFSGNPLLLASVVLLNEQAMNPISQRFGIPGIRTVGASLSSATVALNDELGRPLAYIQWSPPAPAAKLFQQVALPGIMSIVLVGGCIFGLLAWLRRTSLSLESSQTHASFLSLHDALTGAANRILFEQSLREALHYQTLAESKVLLISVDLDRFKEVNDTFGHAAGDELLREVGRRLLVELPEEATLARLGGDEFAVVQPGIVSDGHARWICQRLLQALSDPFVLSTGIMSITVSMGFAVEPPSAISPEELARRADVALYHSKKAGRNRCTLYEPVMDADRKDRLTLEVDLRNALMQDELHLAYQPIFSASGGTIVGAEALCRWQHPVRGLISPEFFIGLAEETGIIDELGLWVLRRACVLAKEIGLPWIAVNVSPVQLNRAGLAEQILKILHEIGFEADRLEIEITEGVLLQCSTQVQDTLSKLRAAGVRIAIDDFGAGYASISYLRNYKIDKIKIDRAFIKSLNDDPSLMLIVRAMIDMGKAMGLSVTAEGVEDDAQRRALTAMGCTHLQGFLLSRPLLPDRLVQLLAEPGYVPSDRIVANSLS